MNRKLKVKIRKLLPNWCLFLYRTIRNYKDVGSVIKFLFNKKYNISFSKRFFIIKRLYIISFKIDCPHNQFEMLSFIDSILSIPQNVTGCIVEAGSYKGGSTAKFSIAAKIANRKLIVFDSFQGIPENSEPDDKDIFGVNFSFKKGDCCGRLGEVKENIKKNGSLEHCEFIEGFFDETMTNFSKPIAAIYLDVDLASSTRTCLKYLYPLLNPNGALFSHEGNLPLVIKAFNDKNFWKSIGYTKPPIPDLGKKKLIKIIKPK